MLLGKKFNDFVRQIIFICFGSVDILENVFLKRRGSLFGRKDQSLHSGASGGCKDCFPSPHPGTESAFQCL